MVLAAPADASARHLAGRLGLVAERIRRAVERRRRGDPDPDDRFRGLYVSDAQVDHLLAGGNGPLLSPGDDPAATAARGEIEAAADAAEEAGTEIRLRSLARTFGLEPLDVELLLVALAPDLDPRFERLYGYLHDDVSRRRASVGLALELCGTGEGSGPARARLGPLAPLVSGGLLVVEEGDRPFLTRALRVPDRVAAHLLGDTTPDPMVEALAIVPVAHDAAGTDALERGIRAGARLAYVRERIGTAAVTVAARALGRVGPPPVVVDLSRLGPGDDPREAAAAAVREARLRGTGLVAGPLDLVADRSPAAVRAWAEVACPAVLHGTRGWDPAWSRVVPFLLDADLPAADERRAIWMTSLGAATPEDVSAAVAALPFRLAPESVVRAAEAGRLTAAAAGRDLTVTDVAAGARAQNAAGLERLARRLEPRVA